MAPIETNNDNEFSVNNRKLNTASHIALQQTYDNTDDNAYYVDVPLIKLSSKKLMHSGTYRLLCFVMHYLIVVYKCQHNAYHVTIKTYHYAGHIGGARYGRVHINYTY